MAPKRLTRREIVQEDRVQAVLTGIYEWSIQNRGLLVVLLAAVIGGGLGSYFWQSYRADQTREFQNRLAEAIEAYHAPLGEDPPQQENVASAPESESPRFTSEEERRETALQNFRTLAADAGSSDIGQLASYYAALISHESGQLEEAKQLLDSVIEGSSGTPTGNLALDQLAYIAELESDYPAASAALQRILDQEEIPFPKDYVLLRLGRNHESAGEAKKALDIYTRLTTEYPSSQYTSEARSRIDQFDDESNGDEDESVSQD